MILSIRHTFCFKFWQEHNRPIMALDFGYTKVSRPSDNQLGVGGWSGGHPDAEIKRGESLKIICSAPRASVQSKNKGGVPLAPPLDPPLFFSRTFRRVEFQFPKVCDSKRQLSSAHLQFSNKTVESIQNLKSQRWYLKLIPCQVEFTFSYTRENEIKQDDFLLIKVFIFLWYRYIVTSDIVHFMFDERKI